MKQKQSVRDVEVAEQRVLVRVDFNVPLDGGKITDDTRIRASLPTIQHLVDLRARVILTSHLGRPKGKPSPEFSLAPVARRLSELLDREVVLADAVVGPSVEAKVAEMPPGGVLFLENVRFEPGEEKNDPELARQLAQLADLYVNDAFGSAHRAHASTVGVARLLPAYSGFLMERELDALGKLLQDPDRPYLAILGGAKVSDKIGVIGNLLDRVDAILVGGGMANTFLLAQGQEIGQSLAEPDFADHTSTMLGEAKRRGVDLLLPTDVIVAPDLDAAGKTVSASQIPPDQSVFDVGPDTRTLFATRIAEARTVFWNGPMGVFERAPFASGTKSVAEAVAAVEAFTVVGGGDSLAAIEQLGVGDRISHLSTGGGASLEFIEGKELPGVAALLDAKGEK